MPDDLTRASRDSHPWNLQTLSSAVHQETPLTYK